MRILTSTDNGNIAVEIANNSTLSEVDNFSWQDCNALNTNDITEENIHYSSSHNEHNSIIIDNRLTNILYTKRDVNTKDTVCNLQFRRTNIKDEINSHIDRKDKSKNLEDTGWQKSSLGTEHFL